MKKKIGRLLAGLLGLILICTACGQAASMETDSNAYELEALVVNNMTALAGMDDRDIAAMAAQYSMDGLTDGEKILLEALETWKELKGTLGDYRTYENFSVYRGNQEIRASLRGKFTERDLDFSMTFSEDLRDLKAVTLNPVYSRGELLKRAGLNTMMGMGTVFTVLILISVLIYAFGFIGRRENRRAAKAEVPVAPDTAPESWEAVNMDEEFELVAVITAAIAASESVSADRLVVRSIRRKSMTEWKRA